MVVKNALGATVAGEIATGGSYISYKVSYNTFQNFIPTHIYIKYNINCNTEWYPHTPTSHTHTHAHMHTKTHTQTDKHTHTHTHTPMLQLCSVPLLHFYRMPILINLFSNFILPMVTVSMVVALFPTMFVFRARLSSHLFAAKLANRIWIVSAK